jgi:Secretion system C-terminal sorting domain
VLLKVYDMIGREVATLVDESKPAGTYTVQFDASRLASGAYCYRLTSSGQALTKLMMLLK